MTNINYDNILKLIKMKNRIEYSNKALLIIAIAISTSINAHAQPGPGGPGAIGSGITFNGAADSGSSPTGGPNVPFDGGMSLILAASGIGYVAKKLNRKK